MSDKPLNLAVLVSGSGRTLQNFIDLIHAGELNAKISVVIGSRKGLKGLERAAKAGLMNFVVDRRSYEQDIAAFSKDLFALCDDAGAELVCMAGWLSLLDVPVRYTG